MAKPTKKQELKQLIEEAEQARARITSAREKASEKLNFVGKAKTSVRETPTKWVGGAAAVGLVSSFLLRPKKRKTHLLTGKKAKRGIISLLFALVVKLIKPAVKIYATKLAKDYLHDRMRSGVAARPVQGRITNSH